MIEGSSFRGYAVTSLGTLGEQDRPFCHRVWPNDVHLIRCRFCLNSFILAQDYVDRVCKFTIGHQFIPTVCWKRRRARDRYFGQSSLKRWGSFISVSPEHSSSTLDQDPWHYSQSRLCKQQAQSGRNPSLIIRCDSSSGLLCYNRVT